jgi:hypothetical protein
MYSECAFPIKPLFVIDLQQIATALDQCVPALFLFKLEALLQEAFLFQKINNDIIKVKDNKLKAISAFAVFGFIY